MGPKHNLNDKHYLYVNQTLFSYKFMKFHVVLELYNIKTDNG